MRTEKTLLWGSTTLLGLREILKAAKKRVVVMYRSAYDRGMLKAISDEMVAHEKLDRPVTKIVIGPKEWNRLCTNPATQHAVEAQLFGKIIDGEMGKMWGHYRLFVRRNMGGKIAVFS